MPNWVRNTIRVKAEDMPKLKELLLDENQNVDFNKILPRPKDLDITSGGYQWVIDKFGFSKEVEENQNKIIKPFLDSIYLDNDTQEQFVNKVKSNLKPKIQRNFYSVYGNKKNLTEERMGNILKGYYNLRKYGYRDWYDWSTNIWGTKWNASETYVESNQIMFDTAWDRPFGVLEKLAEKLNFTFAYADENLGCNFGCGEVTEDHEVMIDDFYELDENEKFYVAYVINNGGYENLEEDMEDYSTEFKISDNRFKELLEIIKYYIDIN